jgi:NTE family protein
LKVGLALGGGGARGLAHLGVLEVLEKEKVPIDIVSGTSMGALIGALYAQHRDLSFIKDKIFSLIEKEQVKKLEENFSSLERKASKGQSRLNQPLLFLKEVIFWNIRLFKKHLVDFEPFESLLLDMYGESQFSDCKIPFLCVSTDLIRQDSVYIQEGLLWKAVFSSIAMPGIFPPIKEDGKILVDGGVLESVPTVALKSRKAGFIVAVSLEKNTIIHDFRHSMEVASSVDETRHKRLVELALCQADFVLEPATSGFGWADFSKIEQIIDKGRQEAENSVSALKKKIKYKKFFSFSPIFRK